jgi:hypothetical protein
LNGKSERLEEKEENGRGRGKKNNAPLSKAKTPLFGHPSIKIKPDPIVDCAKHHLQQEEK